MNYLLKQYMTHTGIPVLIEKLTLRNKKIRTLKTYKKQIDTEFNSYFELKREVEYNSKIIERLIEEQRRLKTLGNPQHILKEIFERYRNALWEIKHKGVDEQELLRKEFVRELSGYI